MRHDPQSRKRRRALPQHTDAQRVAAHEVDYTQASRKERTMNNTVNNTIIEVAILNAYEGKLWESGALVYISSLSGNSAVDDIIAHKGQYALLLEDGRIIVVEDANGWTLDYTPHSDDTDNDDFEASQPCPHCNGTGQNRYDLMPCEFCDGEGFEDAR
jgi:hypothetical protein